MYCVRPSVVDDDFALGCPTLFVLSALHMASTLFIICLICPCDLEIEKLFWIKIVVLLSSHLHSV